MQNSTNNVLYCNPSLSLSEGTTSERSDKTMKGNKMTGANNDILNIDAEERERYQKAVNKVMELLMQVISNAVFLRDAETLEALKTESDSLFLQANKMMNEGSKPDVMAGPASWAL